MALTPRLDEEAQMHDQIRYFQFVAKFVDAVTTEPLAQALRMRKQPVRLLPKTSHQPVEFPSIPRAA